MTRRISGFDDASPMRAALAFAAAGLPVFPLHAPDAAGRCSCGGGCGRNAGKHPRTPRGLTDATTDADRIAAWWSAWPDANVGLRTGANAGAWVLDIDPDKGGEEALEALEAAQGPLPKTWAVETGGGGLHLWFAHPSRPVPNSAGRIASGVDVRGDGGYVVAPPSRHRFGAAYRWGDDWSPALVDLAPAPPWLEALAAAPSQQAAGAPRAGHSRRAGEPGSATAPITEGTRNVTLTSLAGSMRRRGFGEAAILAALTEENRARCVPPLEPPEVERIARSVVRYAPEMATLQGGRKGIRRPAFVEFVGGKVVAR